MLVAEKRPERRLKQEGLALGWGGGVAHFTGRISFLQGCF
jgi:hypothetical protein